MMSQVNAPIHSYENDHKNPHPYYQLKIKKFENSYLANKTRYIDSNLISEQSKKDLFNNLLQNSNKLFIFQSLENCLFDCLLVLW